MKIVITGATSFLGVEVANAFLRRGDEVTAICRRGSRGLADLPEGVSVVYAELPEYSRLAEFISHADIFVHLAWGGTGHDGRDNTEVQEENIRCSTEAMIAAHAMGCQLFVMAGSQAEYGSTDEPQREDMPCYPFSEYGKAKLRVRQACAQLAEQLGMKYMHLRIFSLFGENDHPWTLVMSCVDKMLRHETMDLSDCTQNWNFLYVRDAAEQIVRLSAYALQSESFRAETYNIVSDDTRPLRDFVERIYALTGSHSELHFGAVQPVHRVSLQPDSTKLQAAVGSPITHYTFDEVIRRIIDTYNDKTI